ncbi:MAG: hypothetical protein CL484_12140 [Acidobacteria bacterium]|nr:hypothetical protein [Acidobacteriota bacterium]
MNKPEITRSAMVGLSRITIHLDDVKKNLVESQASVRDINDVQQAQIYIEEVIRWYKSTKKT